MKKKILSIGLSIYLLIPNIAFAKGEKVIPKQPTKQVEIMVKHLPASLPRMKTTLILHIRML